MMQRLLLWMAAGVVVHGSDEDTSFGKKQGSTEKLDDVRLHRNRFVSHGEHRNCLTPEFSGWHDLREIDKYSGAWLSSIEYFVKRTQPQEIGNLEGASHQIAGHYTQAITKSPNDHFDFWIEHLSSYGNRCFMRQWHDLESKWNAAEDKVLADIRKRSGIHTRLMNTSCSTQQARNILKKKKIITAIPYQRGDGIIGQTREFFFEATFWSAWAHGFDKIVVAICRERDLAFVQKFPVHRIIKFYEVYNASSHYHCEGLPQKTLVYVHNSLTGNEKNETGVKWDYDYIYYNEADQITHLRAPKEVFDWLNGKTTVNGLGQTVEEGKYRVALPHRIHNIPQLGEFPPALQEELKKPGAIPVPYGNKKIHEWDDFWAGSCCHEPYVDMTGTMKHTKYTGHCANNTYMLGHGFSFCAVTEHQSYCTPEKNMRKCPPDPLSKSIE